MNFERVIVVFVFVLLILVILGVIGVGIYENTGKICDYCNDRFHEEGWQLRELWLCNRCYFAWDGYASEIWGMRYAGERAAWVYNQILAHKGKIELVPKKDTQ